MASYSANFEKHGAYRIDQATIQKLAKTAQEFTGYSPTIRFKLTDDHEIKDTDLNELLEDAYLNSKYIVEAQIQGR